MNYLLFLLLFNLHSPLINGPAQMSYQSLIMGRWQSESDHKYEVVFTKTSKIDYYDKKIVSTYSYRIKRDSLVAKDKSDNSFYYYSIENLSKKYLSLMYLGRGNIIVFKRELVSQVHQ
jgi:hypothetical protein